MHRPLGGSSMVCTIIVPNLCVPVILGIPFLSHNNVVINHTERIVYDKIAGFDLLHSKPPPAPSPHKQTLKEMHVNIIKHKQLMVAKLKTFCATHKLAKEHMNE
jgi:hypothetical protein